MRQGSQKKNHKWVSRKYVNGKWIYKYPDDGSRKARELNEEAKSYVRGAEGLKKENANLIRKTWMSASKYNRAQKDIAKYSDINSKNYNFDKARDAMQRSQKAYQDNVNENFRITENNNSIGPTYTRATKLAKDAGRKMTSSKSYKQRVRNNANKIINQRTAKYNSSAAGKAKNNALRKKETDARTEARRVMNSRDYKFKEGQKKYSRKIKAGKAKVKQIISLLSDKNTYKNLGTKAQRAYKLNKSKVKGKVRRTYKNIKKG